MMVDDDPRNPSQPPAGAPAGDQAAETEPPEEQDETETEGGDAETDDAQADDDVDEGDEQAGDEGDDDEGEGDDGEQPKRKASRAQRYKRQAERLRAELEATRSRESGSSLPPDQATLARAFEARVYQEIGDPPDPNDPKYKDNPIRFERETQAWLNDQRQVTREVRKEFLGTIQREQERVAGLVADHKERVARFRSKVKDFDTVMARATVPVSPHVERLILESKRSDRVMYHLARDQSKLVKLNQMSPEAAAREIGRIEGRLSLPQPKQQTQARPPVRPLRGGGTSPPSGTAAVNAYIKKQYGPRA